MMGMLFEVGKDVGWKPPPQLTSLKVVITSTVCVRCCDSFAGFRSGGLGVASGYPYSSQCAERLVAPPLQLRPQNNLGPKSLFFQGFGLIAAKIILRVNLDRPVRSSVD